MRNIFPSKSSLLQGRYSIFPARLLLKAGWIFCRAKKNSAPAAAGRFPSRAVTTITLYTDAPALVVYSGGFLDDSIGFPDGTHSCPSCAIALEAQDVPDSPHVLPEHFSITTPEHPFERTIQIQIR